jgi:hypothetical protein
MVTDTKPITKERLLKERVLAPPQPELEPETEEEGAISVAEELVKSLVVSHGEHRLYGRIAHPFMEFYDWISGPPMTERRRNRARLAYNGNFRRPSGLIV